MSLLLALALQAARHVAANPVPPAPEANTPAAVVAAAPAAEWVTIAPDDLLVMELAPDAAGRPRRVVIQLMPPPFSRPWIANIRTLARAHWWDGLSVNRVQDNYVAQWGDPLSDDKARAKRLPALTPTSESNYLTTAAAISEANVEMVKTLEAVAERSATNERNGKATLTGTVTASTPDGWHQRDAYTSWVEVYHGWPIASDSVGATEDAAFWPVHCYGAVGVGRDLSPDAGTGAELYAVIGQAPRQLDRNIAVVGRVIDGIEHLSSLPRGTGALGFYQTAPERTPIVRVRLASDLPAAERPAFQYLSTEGASFARYVALRANRHDSFYIRPAGGVDVCNVPVPVRRAP